VKVMLKARINNFSRCYEYTNTRSAAIKSAAKEYFRITSNIAQ